uniref:Glycolipid transfer protein domain-containing protein 1-like protein n=1 Tax=Callorhinchus milii TaxID=7868 RepID=V9L2D6_CALMI
MRGDWTPFPHRRLIHLLLPSLLVLALVLYLTTLVRPISRPETWKEVPVIVDPCAGAVVNCPQSDGDQGKQEKLDGRPGQSMAGGHLGRCSGGDFLLERMTSAFLACVPFPGDQDILLESYVEGWAQLLKFLNALGTLFGFISDEVVSKMEILQQHRGRDDGDGSHQEYVSLKSMVHHELSREMVDFKGTSRDGLPSGCRTLLRLHRALLWLHLFLDKLGRSSEHESSSTLCGEAYSLTLAHHHGWLVRNTASLAFLALPSRGRLFELFCPGDTGQAVRELQGAVAAIKQVTDITEKVYEQHRMLDLP